MIGTPLLSRTERMSWMIFVSAKLGAERVHPDARGAQGRAEARDEPDDGVLVRAVDRVERRAGQARPSTRSRRSSRRRAAAAPGSRRGRRTRRRRG
jgi:hypothetical protein